MAVDRDELKELLAHASEVAQNLQTECQELIAQRNHQGAPSPLEQSMANAFNNIAALRNSCAQLLGELSLSE